MSSFLATQLAQPRFNMLLLAIFAGLAAIGIYGVIAYSVLQRTREIGIRVALGAQPGDMLALVLRAAIGVYGRLALQTARRTREFGVRVALGATAAVLVRLVAGQSVRLLGLGLLLGTLGAWAGVRVLQHEWPDVPAGDPLIWLGAATVLSFGVALASFFPARRAGRVDPMIALRAQ